MILIAMIPVRYLEQMMARHQLPQIEIFFLNIQVISKALGHPLP